MDPESLPVEDRSRSAREFPCPHCGAEAGTRCQTSSGRYYKERTYVHIDRLLTMYRDAYSNRDDRETEQWSEGYEAGRLGGWREGARDARYTFENTPIYRGARADDRLKGAMKDAGIAPAQSDDDDWESILADQEPPRLRSVPGDGDG